MTYLLRRDAGWISLAELLTSGVGRNLSGLMQKTGFQKSGQLLGGISCHYPGLVVNTQKLLMMMIAFITIKSSLVPLIEGLCAQI